jgi:hypothetical protein
MVLTGTYRLNTALSNNPRNVADQATRRLNYNQRQSVYDNLIRRLMPPETISIERRGNSVTLASTRSPQVTFDVDARERVETYPNGRTSRVRASFSGDQLTVVSNGDRACSRPLSVVPVPGDVVGRRQPVKLTSHLCPGLLGAIIEPVIAHESVYEPPLLEHHPRVHLSRLVAIEALLQLIGSGLEIGDQFVDIVFSFCVIETAAVKRVRQQVAETVCPRFKLPDELSHVCVAVAICALTLRLRPGHQTEARERTDNHHSDYSFYFLHYFFFLLKSFVMPRPAKQRDQPHYFLKQSCPRCLSMGE